MMADLILLFSGFMIFMVALPLMCAPCSLMVTTGGLPTDIIVSGTFS